MVKQRGLGESNQQELTQKGDEHKEEAVTKSGAAGAAQQAKRSASLSASVTWLTASWPGGYSDGSAAVSTDRMCGDLVVRNCHVVSNRHGTGRFGVLARRRRSGARRRLSKPRRSSSVPGPSLGL